MALRRVSTISHPHRLLRPGTGTDIVELEANRSMETVAVPLRGVDPASCVLPDLMHEPDSDATLCLEVAGA